MRLSSLLSPVVVAVVLCACAHPVSVVPDASKITMPADAKPLNKNVAYFIAEDVRSKEVNSPGGGGDSISYFPYRDIETGFYKMLSNVFGNVTKLKTINDTDAIQKNAVVYVITPSILTSSSSSSALTWPPTKFDIEMTCKITDASGKEIASPKVTGVGTSEYTEFKSNFSLSPLRAANDVLSKMQRALLDAPELRQ